MLNFCITAKIPLPSVAKQSRGISFIFVIDKNGILQIPYQESADYHEPRLDPCHHSPAEVCNIHPLYKMSLQWLKSSIRATTISPFSAEDCCFTRTWSPSKIPALIMLSPLTLSIKLCAFGINSAGTGK